MAKIDTSTIEGYAEMTPEQKVAALEALEYDDHAQEVERYKAAVTKANGEAADWKKKHNALLSKDEQDKQAEADEKQRLMDRVAELEKKERISNYKASYLALGYSEELAAESAEAIEGGDMEKVFANKKKFLDEHDKAFKAQLMTGSKLPAGSSNGAAADYAKLIETARSEGNIEAVAYYTRLQQQTK